MFEIGTGVAKQSSVHHHPSFPKSVFRHTVGSKSLDFRAVERAVDQAVLDQILFLFLNKLKCLFEAPK